MNNTHSKTPLNQLEKFVSRINFQRIWKNFLRFNKHLFPHLYLTANLLLGIELGTYRGFTFRYLLLDSRFVMVLAVISYLFIFWQTMQKKDTVLPRLAQLVLELNKLAVIPLLLIQFLMTSLELNNYPNYVYSHYHINNDNVNLIVSFNIFIMILQLLQYSRTFIAFLWRRINLRSIVHFIFLLSVLAFVLPNIQLISRWMYDSGIRMLRTVNLSWEERFIYLNGGDASTGWISRYADFINEQVPDRGVIFIPPQKEAWQMEGNPYYMRWFLYPRFTVQSQEIVAPIPPEAEYILIDKGVWPGMTEYGWPRIPIPADQIVRMTFLNRETNEVTTIRNQAYDPKTMANKWGVIELKKGNK